MTDTPSAQPETDTPTAEDAWVAVPLAEIVPAPTSDRSFRLMAVIIMILLAGLLTAIGWWWWHSRGLEVTIEFERPHGLQAGASVMLNGVQVGEVLDIAILENHRIQVHTRLTAKPDVNAMIARAGTHFWIHGSRRPRPRRTQRSGSLCQPHRGQPRHRAAPAALHRPRARAVEHVAA